MSKRYQLPKTDPEGFKELLQLESYFEKIHWMRPILHLVKIRASQINQCAYCINMHVNKAMADGETWKRIVLLNAWPEAACFSDREKVVLEMTDSLTLIHQTGFGNALYEKAKAFFTDQEIAQLSMAIGLINLWNRVVITSGANESEV
jgi:AhpD family alkylhydroperoxidase